MSQRRIAIITGTSLLLMAIVAWFLLGYAYPEFDKPEGLKKNILYNTVLYYSS